MTENQEETTRTAKPLIDITNIFALDIRIGEIVECTRVPKKDRLLNLIVDVGTERIPVVTNIGSQFTPEQLIGKRVPFFMNLTTSTINGIKSEAMIMVATDADKKYYLLEGKNVGDVLI